MGNNPGLKIDPHRTTKDDLNGSSFFCFNSKPITTGHKNMSSFDKVF